MKQAEEWVSELITARFSNPDWPHLAIQGPELKRLVLRVQEDVLTTILLSTHGRTSDDVFIELFDAREHVRREKDKAEQASLEASRNTADLITVKA